MGEMGIPGLRRSDSSFDLGGQFKNIRYYKRFPLDTGKRTILAFIAEKRRLIDDGVLSADRSSLDALFEMFITLKARGDKHRQPLRPITLQRYRAQYADHIQPVLGARRVADIGPDDIDGLVTALLAKGLGGKSIRNIIVELHGVFALGIRRKIVRLNPADGVQMPAADPRPVVAPSPGHLRAMVAASEGTPWGICVLLAATTGGRRSEILGLTWSAVDGAVVTIARGLQNVPGENGSRLALTPVKTKSSVRQVVLPPFAVERLRVHRRQQAERRLAMPGQWSSFAAELGGLVCDRGDGGPLVPDALSRNYSRIARAVGLPPGAQHLHAARHGVASLLFEEGIPMEVISATLGHASSAFTAQIYAHMSNPLREDAAAAVARALGR